MDYKLNNLSITPSWNCCGYRLCVSVEKEPGDMKKHRYILDTLTKWFVSCEYFWNNTYLVDKK